MNADPSFFPVRNANAAQARPCEQQSETRGTAARILLVDDDPDVLRILRAALQMFNYEVDVARDGATAWDVLCVRAYDIVVTDHMMPRLTGLDLIRKLRRVGRDVPCILISGDLPDLDRDMDLPLQPIRAVDKPVRLEHLISMVRSLLAASPRRSNEAWSGSGNVSFCPA
jgi:DNA-binding response OmpR family regulator